MRICISSRPLNAHHIITYFHAESPRTHESDFKFLCLRLDTILPAASTTCWLHAGHCCRPGLVYWTWSRRAHPHGSLCIVNMAGAIRRLVIDIHREESYNWTAQTQCAYDLCLSHLYLTHPHTSTHRGPCGHTRCPSPEGCMSLLCIHMTVTQDSCCRICGAENCAQGRHAACDRFSPFVVQGVKAHMLNEWPGSHAHPARHLHVCTATSRYSLSLLWRGNSCQALACHN